MKKKFLISTIIFALFMFAISTINIVKAAVDPAVYGTITSLTGSPTITDDGNGNVVITYTKEQINNLKWVKHDDNGIERGMNGWWLGFRVTAPENADLETSLWSGGQTVNKPFKQSIDSDNVRYCSYWVPLTENILESHNETWDAYKYTFEWKNKADAQEPEVKTLTLTIRINPEGTVLDTTPENKANIDNVVKVTVDGHVFRITKGEALKDLTESEKSVLNKLKVKEGYTFDGFFNEDGELVKEDDPIEEDVVLTSKFTKIEIPIEPQEPSVDEPVTAPTPQETQPEPQKDDTPKTGTINVELIFIGMAVVTAIGMIIIKKYSK